MSLHSFQSILRSSTGVASAYAADMAARPALEQNNIVTLGRKVYNNMLLDLHVANRCYITPLSKT